MNKSELYRKYLFAFKFVNKNDLIGDYPNYFKYTVYDKGSIIESVAENKVIMELGQVRNDFHYQEGVGDRNNNEGNTDYGISKGCLVELDGEEVVCVTHETGLEIFLFSVGAFVGMEVSKYTLKRLLENTEKRLTGWFRNQPESIEINENESYIEKILVRTPCWEINIDGRFTGRDRDKLFEYISLNLRRSPDIEDYLSKMKDGDLSKKILSATRQVNKVWG